MPLLHFRGLWECAPNVGVHVFLVGKLDDEDHVVLRFEGRDDSAVAGFVGNRFAVDGCDNRGLTEADLIGEGTGANVGYDDATLNAGLARDGWRNSRDGDAELTL